MTQNGFTTLNNDTGVTKRQVNPTLGDSLLNMYPTDLTGYSSFDKSKIHFKKLRLWLINLDKSKFSQEIQTVIGQGLNIRIAIMETNIVKIFPILAMETPSYYDIADLNTHLNSLYIHFRGYLDNFAAIIAELFGFKAELEDEKGALQITFHSKHYRKYLSEKHPMLMAVLSKQLTWLDNLKQFRDPIAHGLPLYVAPLHVPTEQIEAYNTFIRDRDKRFYETLEKEDFSGAGGILNEPPPVGKFEPIMYKADQSRIYNLEPQISLDTGNLFAFSEVLIGILAKQTVA